jgi:TolB-like protein/Flp pilus assembly protein TadD
MSIFNELKRRNVFRVAIAYIISAWLLLQVADVLVPMLDLPDWAAKLIFLILFIGFAPALIFAWAFEMTPEGLKREKDVDRSQSITPITGRKLDRTIILIMGVALLYFIADKFWLSPAAPAPTPDSAQEAPAESPVQSIAVLPLADMSPQGDHEYFSDGLTEELLNILAKIKELRVAGRTSSFAFKGKNEDLRSIAEKLNVGSILEGSVRKDDQRNRVRITLQLINAEDGYHLWSETYDRDLDDIFTIQEEVPSQVARAMRITLLGEEEMPQAVAVTEFNAYDLYLRGLKGLNEFSYASLARAEEDFQRALTLDPAYTPTQIGLIRSWLLQSNTGLISREEASNRALPLLTMILQREPDNSDAHVQMARVLHRQRDYAGAEREYRAALEIDARNIAALGEFGGFLRDRERIDEAMPYINRAAEIEPYSTEVQHELCWSYTWLSDLEGALEARQRIREIDPDSPMGYYGASLAHRVAGNLAQSVAWDVQAFERDPDDQELQAHLSEQWMGLGDFQEAESWLERAEATGPEEPATVAARVSALLHREQTTRAAQLAAGHLGGDDRFWSRDILRNAFVADALKRGDANAALESYRIDNAWFFEEPLQIDMERSSWTASDLIEMAHILKKTDLASSKADELLDAARALIDGAHPDITHWLADINRAGLEATRGNDEEALRHLDKAYENGMRFRWRHWFQRWFPLESVRELTGYRQLIAQLESDMENQLEETHRLLEAGP